MTRIGLGLDPSRRLCAAFALVVLLFTLTLTTGLLFNYLTTQIGPAWPMPILFLIAWISKALVPSALFVLLAMALVLAVLSSEGSSSELVQAGMAAQILTLLSVGVGYSTFYISSGWFFTFVVTMVFLAFGLAMWLAGDFEGFLDRAANPDPRQTISLKFAVIVKVTLLCWGLHEFDLAPGLFHVLMLLVLGSLNSWIWTRAGDFTSDEIEIEIEKPSPAPRKKHVKIYSNNRSRYSI